ncbi:MAG: hypothetical protein OQK12_12360 [Motiliproteus sp.]|nr:hypothetical protein [Motiliproteus sp.]MCW9051926.1 hypothetical protein [Motiliproteus sp.]
MVKPTSVQLGAEQLSHEQRKWQLQQQRQMHMSRLKQSSMRSRTSSDYRHKRMP